MFTQEALKSELDIFAPTPTQTSIEQSLWCWYKPLASIDDSSVVEYVIPGNSDQYLDLAHTMHYIRAKITKSDGTDLPDNAVAAFVNNAAHSLWRTCDTYFNSTRVSSAAQNYAYTAFIETKTGYGPAAKNSHLATSGWIDDESGKMDDFSNKGLLTRVKKTAKSAEVEFFAPVFSDVFNMPEYLLNGVEVKTVFTRNKDEFVIMCKETVDLKNCKVKILEASLAARKVKLNPKILLAHEAALSSGTAKYNFTRTEIKTKTFSSGSSTQCFDNIYLGSLPTRVIVGLVTNDAFKGSYAANPFNFRNFDLNYCIFYADNEPIPSKALTPNYEKGLFIRAYHTLFSGTGIHYQDDGNNITPFDFANGVALYAFDLTPDLSASETNHWNPVRQGQLKLELGFSKVLPEAVVCVVYSEFQSLIQIDKNRNVIVDY